LFLSENIFIKIKTEAKDEPCRSIGRDSSLQFSSTSYYVCAYEWILGREGKRKTDCRKFKYNEEGTFVKHKNFLQSLQMVLSIF
jgi:hypothetical protein